MEHMPQIFIEGERDFEEKKNEDRIDDMLYLIVSKLAKSTGEVTFGCTPGNNKNYYIGLTNFLEKHGVLL
jgi:hypothetical protein